MVTVLLKALCCDPLWGTLLLQFMGSYDADILLVIVEVWPVLVGRFLKKNIFLDNDS